jgi:hypothetical protein
MARPKFNLQIRTGETFLYRKRGTESQVFEVRLREQVVDKSLFSALRQAYGLRTTVAVFVNQLINKIILVLLPANLPGGKIVNH